MNIKVTSIQWAMATACVILLSSFTLFPKKEVKNVYAYGVAASFTDSTVYFTAIQQLDSVTLTKEGFLPERQQYSYQLKYHLENQGLMHRTCMVFFNTDKDKLTKKQSKLMERYLEDHIQVKLIELESFHFLKPEPSEPVEYKEAPKPKGKPEGRPDGPKGRGGPGGGRGGNGRPGM